MPETYRAYPIHTLALLTYSKPPAANGMQRYQAGDIVANVRDLEGIGLKECKDFLWLRIQGWDSSLMDRLMDEITDRSQADPLYVDESEEPTVLLEKARYSIPLESLRRVMPNFSVERATDPTDIYQPFMQIDEGNITNLATTYLDVDVDPYIWLPRLIDKPEVLETALANLTENSTLRIPRTIAEPQFREQALDAGYFLITHPPFDPDGLIFDKLTQRYLYA